MTQEEELKKIKKVYGENFMKMCRGLFPIILEEEGRLYEILSSSFSDNCKTLYEDIKEEGTEIDFKNFIYNKFHEDNPEPIVSVEGTPYELLDKAGYILTECTTEEEIQSFKKYYAKNEELCTFHGGRLDRCVVFFAVKKDAEDIKREDFENPKREDEYGTSVMGIQFDKEGACVVSIKNRYNHRVKNPDATYGNDLDRIIPGLEKSFADLLKERGLELNSANKDTLDMTNYVVASDGKFYRYNMEINGIYYCPGNMIIKDGEVSKLENPEQQMLIDYFILDTKNKTIKLYDETIKDSFVDDLQDLEKIEVTKNKERGTRVLTIQKGEGLEPIVIEINKNNEMVKYVNNSLKEVGDNFLCYQNSLEEIEVQNLERFGDRCLTYNTELEQLDIPNVKEIGDEFLCANQKLNQFNAPKVERIGNQCLRDNEMLRKLDMANVQEIGDFFMNQNQGLIELKAPNLRKVGYRFCPCNIKMSKLELANLEEAGEEFFERNENFTELNVPKNKKIQRDFRKIVDKNNKEKLQMENNEGNSEISNKLMNRFGGWYSAIDRVSETSKAKFIKMKSDIIKAISGKLKERTNNTQENEQNQDTDER